MQSLTSEQCLTLIRVTVSIGLIIDCMEYIYNRKHFEKNGIFSGYIFKRSFLGTESQLAKFLRRRLSTSHGFLCFMVIRLLLIITTLAPQGNLFYFLCFLSLFIIEILINFRSLFGRDGSDHMDSMIIIGLAFAYLLKNESYEIWGIAFIAFQSCLSYITSGIAKIFSTVWRKGEAIKQILNAHSYGSAKAGMVIQNIPYGGRIACLAVIILECIFPLVIFLPLKISIWILMSGVLFHLVNALFMGLNKFFWSWIATYPAIIFCHQII